MSTILRPVGPLDQRVYWIRRAVIIGIILILIIVLAESCSGSSGKGKGKTPVAGGHTTAPTTTSTTTAKPPVPACDPSALKLTVSTDTATYTVRQAPKLIGTFSNQAGPTCKLARSADNEIWTVKSGTPTVWSTQGCPGDPVPKHLKLTTGATKTVSIFWNAHLRTSACTEGAFAEAGTYTLTATLDGVTAAHPAVFQVS